MRIARKNIREILFKQENGYLLTIDLQKNSIFKLNP